MSATDKNSLLYLEYTIGDASGICIGEALT